MRHLISTEVSNQGHSMNFEYTGSGEEQKCFMSCQCGWRVEIESFRNSWSVIEVKVRVGKHLKELGINPENSNSQAIFSFD